MAKPLVVRLCRGQVKEIKVHGARDPRGPDNTITIWISDDDELHIRVQKPALRCYEFTEQIDAPGYVEVIQT